MSPVFDWDSPAWSFQKFYEWKRKAHTAGTLESLDSLSGSFTGSWQQPEKVPGFKR